MEGGNINLLVYGIHHRSLKVEMRNVGPGSWSLYARQCLVDNNKHPNGYYSSLGERDRGRTIKLNTDKRMSKTGCDF